MIVLQRERDLDVAHIVIGHKGLLEQLVQMGLAGYLLDKHQGVERVEPARGRALGEPGHEGVTVARLLQVVEHIVRGLGVEHGVPVLLRKPVHLLVPSLQHLRQILARDPILGWKDEAGALETHRNERDLFPERALVFLERLDVLLHAY